MVTQKSLRLCLLFLHLFLLAPDHFNCPIFKFTDTSACSNLPLNPSTKIFFLIIVIFSSRISFLFLFRLSISLMIFPFYSYIICLTFSLSSFKSLSICKIVILKSLSSSSAIWSFSETVSVP